MREILFRGKKSNGKWAYGSLINPDDDFCCILSRFVDSEDEYDYPYLDGDLGIIDGRAIPVDPKTIGQYTGFNDANGRKIFEGDIVERAYSVNKPNLRMYVVEHKGSWVLWSHEDDEDFLSNWCNPHYLNGKDIGGCIVVGNIHDNPELVTGSTLTSSSDGVF